MRRSAHAWVCYLATFTRTTSKTLTTSYVFSANYLYRMFATTVEKALGIICYCLIRALVVVIKTAVKSMPKMLSASLVNLVPFAGSQSRTNLYLSERASIFVGKKIEFE
jgi:hypothetical protein